MFFDQWAEKWGIHPEAIADLKNSILSTENSSLAVQNNFSEAAVLDLVREEATKKGARLWRNNRGAVQTPGGFMRFGLANESSEQNKRIKSADLIGIRPILITQAHVGKTVGQFLSREIKAGGWKPSSSDPHLRAQLAWADFINAMGGDARIATGVGSL
jgi:hypothetical protein